MKTLWLFGLQLCIVGAISAGVAMLASFPVWFILGVITRLFVHMDTSLDNAAYIALVAVCYPYFLALLVSGLIASRLQDAALSRISVDANGLPVLRSSGTPMPPRRE